jgi:uncharacterized protein YkwD
MGVNDTQILGTPSCRGRSRLRTRLAVAAALAGVLCLVILANAQRAPAHGWYAGARTACAQSTSKMRCYHEQTRRLAGLSWLRSRTRLRGSAKLKSDRIVECQELSHWPCGDSVLRPFYGAAYLPWAPSWLAGENLAWGFPTAWDAFHALMHSTSHRENILKPAFRDIGIWRGPTQWGRLWVIHFGRRW